MGLSTRHEVELLALGALLVQARNVEHDLIQACSFGRFHMSHQRNRERNHAKAIPSGFLSRLESLQSCRKFSVRINMVNETRHERTKQRTKVYMISAKPTAAQPNLPMPARASGIRN